MARASNHLQFYDHIDRDPDAPEGVRVVQFLKIAYNKDGPDMAIYRPANTETFVYLQGGWDYRPLKEFLERYKVITDSDRIAELEAIIKKIY